MITPRVSVLLPVRDAIGTLASCIASIQAQTLADFELIFVDDGSTDGSVECMAAYAERDTRVRVLANPEPGLVGALNHGLQAARSDLVARMDSDDLMHPHRLALQADAMRIRPNLAVLGSRVRAFPEDTLSDGFRAYIDWQNSCVSSDAIASDIYLESPLAHPSVMLRRGVVLAAGGYRSGDFPEDYELWLRLFAAGHRLGKLPGHLLAWRDHRKRLSRVDARYAREAFDRLRADYLARDPRVRAAPDRLVIWGAGRKTRRRADRLLAHGLRPLAWIDIDPRKIGNRIDGVPVVEPGWLAGRSPRPLVLSYVTVHGARTLIEAELARMGYRKGTHYLHVG